MAVDIGHIAFVFEILNRADTTEKKLCAERTGEVYSKAGVDGHFHSGVIGIKAPDCSGAVGRTRLGTGFGCVHSYSYDDVVEKLESAAHYVVMTACKWVEGTGKYSRTPLRTGQFLYHLL